MKGTGSVCMCVCARVHTCAFVYLYSIKTVELLVRKTL